jgi:hypothetical protein
VDPRTYTVEEANEVLPEVRRLVIRIVELMSDLPELQESAHIQELKNHRAGETDESREALAQSVATLRSAEMSVAVALERLEAMDVVLKDPRLGLIDFFGYRDGELVELCWQLGEDAVGHWHRIGEGYAGRKPV